MTLSDEEIVAQYNNGDEEAIVEIVHRYTPTIYNFVAHIATKNDAPDIVQEVFIKVWKNLARFDSTKASFKTWIFTIARNTANDFLRKKKFVLFSDIKTDSEDDIDDFSIKIADENMLASEVLEKLQDSEQLNKTLEKLSSEEREILLLHYQEDMTFDEIGRISGKNLNTVKSKHRRALIKMQKLLSEFAPKNKTARINI